MYSIVPALLHFRLIGASSEPSGQSTSPSHCHRVFTRQRPSAHWNSPVPHCRYPRKEEASLLQASITEINQRSTLSGHSTLHQPGRSLELCEKYFSFLSITALRNACCVEAGIKVKYKLRNKVSYLTLSIQGLSPSNPFLLGLDTGWKLLEPSSRLSFLVKFMSEHMSKLILSYSKPLTVAVILYLCLTKLFIVK